MMLAHPFQIIAVVKEKSFQEDYPGVELLVSRETSCWDVPPKPPAN
jgi:hypothetical protein